MIPKKNHYESASHLYESFSHFEVDDVFSHTYVWPEPQSLFGRGFRLGYYSDKFDGVWRAYTHAHGEEKYHGTEDTTYPAIIVQRDRSLPSWNRFFAPPPSGELAILGFALDLQYFIDSPLDEPEQLDWKDPKFKRNLNTDGLPWLLGDENRNLLVIAPRDGDTALLLWSPIMRISPRGIIN